MQKPSPQCSAREELQSCPLCGQKYMYLSLHLQKTHGVSSAEAAQMVRGTSYGEVLRDLQARAMYEQSVEKIRTGEWDWAEELALVRVLLWRQVEVLSEAWGEGAVPCAEKPEWRELTRLLELLERLWRRYQQEQEAAAQRRLQMRCRQLLQGFFEVVQASRVCPQCGGSLEALQQDLLRQLEQLRVAVGGEADGED